MTEAHDEILKEAFEIAASDDFGEGGKAAAKYYRSNRPDDEQMLYAIAALVNRVADLEQAAGTR